MADRPPRESLEEILTIEGPQGDGYRAALESFWGETVKGDLIARAVLVATDGSADDPGGVQAVFPGRARPDVVTSLTRKTLGQEDSRLVATRSGDPELQRFLHLASLNLQPSPHRPRSDSNTRERSSRHTDEGVQGELKICGPSA